jgi:hypothetical protein
MSTKISSRERVVSEMLKDPQYAFIYEGLAEDYAKQALLRIAKDAGRYVQEEHDHDE